LEHRGTSDGLQNPLKKWTEGSVVQGTPKGWTFEKRCLSQLECNNGIRNCCLKEQLRLGSRRAFNKTVRQTLRLEVVKQVVESSIRLQKISDWRSWRSWPPPKRKKRLHNHSTRTKMLMVHLDQLAPY
jgi:hypothetical protein